MIPKTFQKGDTPSRATSTCMVPTTLFPPCRPMSISAIRAGMAITIKAMK